VANVPGGGGSIPAGVRAKAVKVTSFIFACKYDYTYVKYAEMKA
jgi:hypothetical protein